MHTTDYHNSFLHIALLELTGKKNETQEIKQNMAGTESINNLNSPTPLGSASEGMMQ